MRHSISKPILTMLITLLTVTACNNHVIPKDVMTNILTDMHIADAVRDRGDVNLYQNRMDSLSVYGTIFTQYGYTIDDFNQSILFYLEQPEVIKEIYDDVIARLKADKKEYTELLAKERKEQNLWAAIDSIYIDTDSAYNKMAFNIPVSGKGTYIFTADLQVFSDDSTKNPRMVAWLASVDKPDTVVAKKEIKIEKNTSSKPTLKVYFNDTLMTQLKGYLFTYDTITAGQKQHVEIKNIYIEYVKGDGIDYTISDTIPLLPQKGRQTNTVIRQQSRTTRHEQWQLHDSLRQPVKLKSTKQP